MMGHKNCHASCAVKWKQWKPESEVPDYQWKQEANKAASCIWVSGITQFFCNLSWLESWSSLNLTQLLNNYCMCVCVPDFFFFFFFTSFWKLVDNPEAGIQMDSSSSYRRIVWVPGGGGWGVYEGCTGWGEADNGGRPEWGQNQWLCCIHHILYAGKIYWHGSTLCVHELAGRGPS